MKIVPAVLIVCIIMAFCVPVAFADSILPEHPVLPYGHPEDNIPIPEKKEITIVSEAEIQAASTMEIDIIQTGEPPEAVNWTVSASGGDGNYQYQFSVYYLEENDDGTTTSCFYEHQDYSSENFFSYTFPQNGNWQLWVNVTDESGNETFDSVNITVDVEGMDPFKITTVEESGEYITGTTTWTVHTTGGSGNYTYMYYILENDSTFGSNNVVSVSDGYIEDNTFSYQFMANGNYELLIWAEDENENWDSYQSTLVVNVDGYQTVSEKVKELAAQCKSAGCSTDYEIALWFHDWLIDNADYDYSYSHYHADGVLFAGTGVCDSYSKAYLLLLEEAGIPSVRISNYGHSWNALQIEGEWYTADVTWDDQNGDIDFINHIYCFIPDEIMDVDHKNHDSTVSCNSCTYNYFVQTGIAYEWANEIATNVVTGLNSGQYSCLVTLPESYRYNISETSFYIYSDRSDAGTVVRDLLSLKLATEETEHYYNGVEVPLTYSYNYSTDATATVNFAGSTVTIPEGVSFIEAEAFSGVEMPLCIVIQDKVTEIESGAFENCGSLWAVYIPDSVTKIADGAFDADNSHLTIIAPEGSTAENYAESNGIQFENYDGRS